MGVDPADNSYMPSVIVVNGGHSINSMSELNIVNVKSHETSVLLLSNLDKVSPELFEIIKLTFSSILLNLMKQV